MVTHVKMCLLTRRLTSTVAIESAVAPLADDAFRIETQIDDVGPINARSIGPLTHLAATLELMAARGNAQFADSIVFRRPYPRIPQGRVVTKIFHHTADGKE